MKLNSLRTKLFIWYVGSLILVIGYFLLFIHYYRFPYAIQVLILLFVVLAVVQFWVVYKITKSINKLSAKMKMVNSENLEEKITGIGSDDEIGELATSFNNLLDRLHQAFQREQQFIADVAHELKTPLTTIKSSFEVALNRPRSNEEYKEIIEGAVAETDQLSRTLKNVLDLAWSEAPASRQQKTKFDLSQVIDDLYEIAQKLAIKRKIKIELTATKNVFINGFKDKLARAVLNLIDNAIKYSPVGGKVEIILEKTPNKALISIVDQGPGISEEEIPQIFNRFYRGSKTDKVFGAGLGLAITKAIITLHQGEIKVKSSKSHGSTFIVVLPLVV